MALYRFLFAPALLAIAVLAGPGPGDPAAGADPRAPSRARPALEASHQAAPPRAPDAARPPRPVRAH